MPWKVVKDTNACPVSKPYAVKNTQTGSVNGRCHATKAQAEDQRKAMYANYRKEGKSVSVEEYPQIVRAITGTPWLIVPENLQAILDIVNMRLNGQAYSDDELRIRIDAAKDSERENPNVQVGGGVGVLSLYGPMFPKANLMTMLSGATSLESFQTDLQTLVDNEEVKQIVIDYNSPGGTSDMVHETGDLIRQAREVKPIYGIANTIAGSGALWLLSQSTKAYATQSGKVGSLGVYTTHEDLSAEDAKSGRKITIISAGHLKTAGNPHEPLTEEARAYLQESVDELHQTFVEEVAKGRNLDPTYVAENFDGKLLSANKAKDVGMVDGVMNMRDLLDGLVATNYQSSSNKTVGMLADRVAKVQALAIEQSGPLGMNVESKEWEHSEPGLSNPPPPRRDEDGSDDAAVTGGWRRPTPPDQTQPQGTSTSSDMTEGGSKLDDNQLEELRRLFSLDVDAGGDSIVEAAKLQYGELREIKRNASLADQTDELKREYPQLWEEHNELMETNRKHSADAFVASVTHALKAEHMGFREARLGLSSRAKEAVSDLHIRLAGDKELQTEFEQVMKTVMKGGLVPLGEIGSTKKKDGEEDLEFDTTTPEGIAQARNALSSLVKKHMAENPGTDYRTALAHVSAQHQELADARQPIPA